MYIRETLESDAESLAALIDEVCRERLYLAATVGFSVENTSAFISSVKSAGGIHLVATEQENVIGWCDITPYPFEGMTHVGKLGMGVKKIYRSKGVGGNLLTTALGRAVAQKLDRIELEVFASNQHAINMYEAFGFLPEGRKVGARKLDGIADDIILFATSNSLN